MKLGLNDFHLSITIGCVYVFSQQRIIIHTIESA